jgi:hypothetical protein
MDYLSSTIENESKFVKSDMSASMNKDLPLSLAGLMMYTSALLRMFSHWSSQSFDTLLLYQAAVMSFNFSAKNVDALALGL